MRRCLPVLALPIVIACTGRPPQISDVFWQINQFADQTEGISYERLSVFIEVDDPDGFEELESVYLIHDEQELFWELSTESWATTEADGRRWVGANSICMPDYSPMPRGDYRVLVQDLGGDAAETQISITTRTLSPTEIGFPAVSIRNGQMVVSGPFERYTVWVYEKGGKFRAAYAATAYAATASAPVTDEKPDTPAQRIAVGAVATEHRDLSGGFDIYLSAERKNFPTGFVSGPYQYPPLQGQ